MKCYSTTGSDSRFSPQAWAKRSKPAIRHLTLILSWKERKENRQLFLAEGRGEGQLMERN
jgi:hypothetical protein